MEFNIAVLPGDGIGPEVIAEGVKTLDAVGKGLATAFDTPMTTWAASPSTSTARP